MGQPKADKRKPAGQHEGATEHLEPGKPANREVSTPGWAELEKMTGEYEPAKGDATGGTQQKRPKGAPGKPGR